MFWEEEEDKSLPYVIPKDVIDLNFAISCKSLPINHSWYLSKEIAKHLPWIIDDGISGIHQIHVAESNNGWMRPDEDEEGALLHPSRRTKLCLRIPSNKLNAAQNLTNEILDIDGYSLTVGKSKIKELTNTSIIFSRYIISDENEEENSFLQRMASEIFNRTGFKIKKMLCGKSHSIITPKERLSTKHLMIADLTSEASIKIQQFGLGTARNLGCGIFLPHKGIKSLNPTE